MLLLFWCGAAQAQTFTVLHAFSGGEDGAYPYGGVSLDRDGNVYGVTSGGGTYGNGAIYKVDPSGTTTTLHSMNHVDGCYSDADVLVDSTGTLYGTTALCGRGIGTVFELRKGAERIRVLHAFADADGGSPTAGLTRDKAGNLFGTTPSYGAGNDGTAFKLDRRTGGYTVLHDFRSPPGAAVPRGLLTLGEDGNLYGVTQQGGSAEYGTVFMLSTDGLGKVLYSFTGGSDGGEPWGRITRDERGNLYGATVAGGLGFGTVFKLNPNGVLTVLHTFGSYFGDGSTPRSGLIGDEDGNLYGTTYSGGKGGGGTVFMIDKDGNFTILHHFSGHEGSYPFAGLARDEMGNLYGTALFGGDTQCDCGVVFKISP